MKGVRGFAALPPHLRKKMAALGGRAAHAKGVGHEWTSQEAAEAGRKGGVASGRLRRARGPVRGPKGATGS